MNMNAIMQQSQKMQKQMQQAQDEIENKIFKSKQELVEVEMGGNGLLKSVKVSENISSEDVEILEDMILLAVNDAVKQINKEKEEKLGQFGKGIPGLF